MQQYADIHSLPRHSTRFGRHAPIIRSTKNCICYRWCTSCHIMVPFLPSSVAWSGRKKRYHYVTWRTPEVADTVFGAPDDGCMTPETCRVAWQRVDVCILLHRVGPLLALNHDARSHVFKNGCKLVKCREGHHVLLSWTALKLSASFCWYFGFLYRAETQKNPSPLWTTVTKAWKVRALIFLLFREQQLLKS